MRPVGRWSAYRVYLLLNGLGWTFQLMAFPMLAVYYLTVVGLNPFQLAVVGAVQQAVVLAGEVPTGVVADVYSRRLSVILGLLLTGLGFALEGAVPRFDVILLAQVVRGLGMTFTSGATTAWITDELGEAAAREALLHGAQAGQWGGLTGNLLSAALASLYVGLPILLGGVLLVLLGLGLALVMPEERWTPAMREPVARDGRAAWGEFRQTLREGLRAVRARPALFALLGAGLFWGVFGEGVDRFWEAHVLRDYPLPALGALKPVAWFGVFNLGAMLMSMLAVAAVTRRLRASASEADGRLLVGLYALSGLATLVFGLVGGLGWAVAAFWASVLFSAAVAPLTEVVLNRGLPASVRATVLSLRSQMAALGQLGGGLLLGWLATAVSLRAAIACAGLALAPALILLLRARRAAEPRNAA